MRADGIRTSAARESAGLRPWLHQRNGKCRRSDRAIPHWAACPIQGHVRAASHLHRGVRCYARVLGSAPKAEEEDGVMGTTTHGLIWGAAGSHASEEGTRMHVERRRLAEPAST